MKLSTNASTQCVCMGGGVLLQSLERRRGRFLRTDGLVRHIHQAEQRDWLAQPAGNDTSEYTGGRVGDSCNNTAPVLLIEDCLSSGNIKLLCGYI